MQFVHEFNPSLRRIISVLAVLSGAFSAQAASRVEHHRSQSRKWGHHHLTGFDQSS